MSGEEVTVSELGQIVTGKTPSTKNAAFFDGEYPFITPSDLDWRTYYCQSTERVVSEDARAAYSSQFVPADSVMVTCIGNTIGKCAITLSTSLTNQQINTIVPRETIPAKFVYYLLVHNTELIRQIGLGGGAATPILNKTNFSRITLMVPPRNSWSRISEILSAYDDLIENNRRRMALLEESARQLYSEWFVRLRFPGHERVKITDDVPEGWEKVAISSFCTVGRGGSPRPIRDFLGGFVPWFKIGDATASDSPFVFSTVEAIIESGVRKSVLLHPKELILSNSATCGIPYFTGITGCIHDGWLYFKNLSRVSKWFLYCYLYDKKLAILSGIGEGATQKNLNTNYIGSQIVSLPRSPALIDHFNSVAEPLFSQVFTLAEVNKQLRQARDLLLSKLMNREITV